MDRLFLAFGLLVPVLWLFVVLVYLVNWYDPKREPTPKRSSAPLDHVPRR